MTDFSKKYLLETINAINTMIIDPRTSILTTKRIRRHLKIKASNRSRINFIWRSLHFLEQKGILKRYDNSIPKKYLLPKDVINISN